MLHTPGDVDDSDNEDEGAIGSVEEQTTGGNVVSILHRSNATVVQLHIP